MKVLRRTMMAAAALVMALGAASCDDSATAPGDPPPPGRYRLVSINDQTLPFELQNDAGGRIEVTDGRIDIEGREYLQELLFRLTPAGGVGSSPQQSVSEGTVGVSGTRITFDPRLRDVESYSGTIMGSIITYSIQGNNGTLTFKFMKE